VVSAKEKKNKAKKSLGGIYVYVCVLGKIKGIKIFRSAKEGPLSKSHIEKNEKFMPLIVSKIFLLS
jgi:hypothetical protein